MVLSGIQKLTLLHFPGTVACIASTPGCTMRCGFCHNPEFVLPEMLTKIKGSFIPQEVFFHFLDSRKGLLEGVVVSGGEPTVHMDLPVFLEKIKAKGYVVKLDTNGARPDILHRTIEETVVDYVAMDVKTSPSHYQTLTGNLTKAERVQESIDLLKKNKIPYEFRSTLIQEVHNGDVLREMAQMIDGAKKLFLQTFRPQHTLDSAFERCHPFTFREMEEIADTYFRPVVSSVVIR